MGNLFCKKTGEGNGDNGCLTCFGVQQPMETIRVEKELRMKSTITHRFPAGSNTSYGRFPTGYNNNYGSQSRYVNT